MINSDDGKESALLERKGRRQHFMEVFRFQGYLIQLRLDWDDVRSGDPMLDADIWTEINGRKKFLRKRGQQWHHTEKKLDEKTGKKLYTFKFRNLTLHLIAEMTIAKTYAVDTILVRFAPACMRARHISVGGRASPAVRAIQAFDNATCFGSSCSNSTDNVGFVTILSDAKMAIFRSSQRVPLRLIKLGKPFPPGSQ